MVQRLIEFWNAFSSLFRTGNKQQELDEEVSFHIEERTQELIEQGKDRKLAQQLALQEFGGVEKFKDECRDTWGTRVVADLIRDLRFSLRVLGKAKFFTSAVIITLALCIGGNSAIFSMLNTLVLKPLPFHESDRIVEVFNTFPKSGIQKATSTIPLYLDYKENTDAFAELALLSRIGSNFGELDSVERIDGYSVTEGFFRMLRVQPVIGSFFREDDMILGQHRFVVLSYSFWQKAFAASLDVPGETIELDGETFTIRGVAPQILETVFPETMLYTSLAWNPAEVPNMHRYGYTPRLYGRLNPGVSIDDATTQISYRDRVYYDNTPEHQNFIDQSGHASVINGVQAERVKDIKGNLFLMQIGALAVLAIGCVNIANLTLIRSDSRQSEIAIRCAIGAKSMTVVRLLVIESLLLTLGGFFLGGLFGWVGVKLINAYAMDLLPPMQDLSLDANTLLFSLSLAIIAGLFFGAFPALRIFKLKVASGLRRDSWGSSLSRGSQIFGSVLVCGQLSLALVLLIVAGLFIYSFSKLLSDDFGFEPENVTTMRISLPPLKYNTVWSIFEFQNQVLEAVRTLPQVSSAGMATQVPLVSEYPFNAFNIYGYDSPDEEEIRTANHTFVSPGYFESLGIEIVQGEGFGLSDVAENRRTVVIDQVLADRYFPNENPIGRKLGFVGKNTKEAHWPYVIGVVEKVQHMPIGETEGVPFIYNNIYRMTAPDFSLFIKSSLDYETLITVVRNRIRELDSNVPLFQSGRLEEFVGNAFNNRRALMLLLAIFAGIAIALAAIGIYGVLAYSVSQQCREIGIRAVLGAEKRQIELLYLKRGFIKTTIGLAIGLMGSFALGKFISSMLYQVEPTEPIVILSVSMALFIVSMLACYLPARKAAKIQPMEVLRLE